MIVLYKEDGEEKYTIRPAYIGFIKNNYIRRTLMILFAPILISILIVANIIQLFLYIVATAIFGTLKVFYNIFKNIKNIPKNMKKYWDEPRTK